jgi:RNA polymerase sigma factor (sigma-70 family)
LNSKIVFITKHGHINGELLQRCCDKDQRALKELYEFCFHALMPICVRYHVNQEDARASLNQGFMKIIKGLPQVIEAELNFSAWSKRVMANSLIDEYRTNRKYSTQIQSKETEREVEVYGESYFNDGDKELDYNALLSLLDNLNPMTKQVFGFFAIDGYTHMEISEMLDIPLGTSKWHVSIARKLLKEMLEKEKESTTIINNLAI